ncbi:MAG: hypothetical protein Q9226_004276 [Calogaya cf. arnoldii]
MVHTGRDLVPKLLGLYTVIIYGLCDIKERRKQLKDDERMEIERQKQEAELRTTRGQLNAAEAQIKSLGDEARKRRAAESRPFWRRFWQDSLVKPKDGRSRDA